MRIQQRNHLVLAACFILCSFQLSAQLNRSAYGIFGHYSYAMHAASFQSLPGLPCCSPSFQNGTGNGLALGMLYQMPLSNQWTLSGRLSYLPYPGTLVNDQPTTVNIAGSPIPATIHYELDATLASVNVEPLIGYRITDRFTLHGGASIGIVTSRTFRQREPLITASGQGRQTVPDEVGSGELPNASTLSASLMAGMSFDIPLFRGSRWFLTPEVFYSLGLSNVISDRTWSVNTLRLGIAVKYSPPQFALPEPSTEQSVRLVAGVRAVGMQTPDGDPEPIVLLKVEEFLSRTHKPLLPYVFFESGSAELQREYHQLQAGETASFTPERFNDSTLLSVYYDMLNIIGKRMNENASSRLTLTGCNSNVGTEKGNLALSQRRAESVKRYLTTIWGIDEARIEVKARNLPANPSNINKDEGIAENRRIEITTDDPKLLAPLVTRDTTRIASPPIVRFLVESESEAGIGSYSVAASQNNTLLQAFNGTGTPPEKIDWYLQDNPTSLPRAETPMNYDIRVTDLGAQDFTSPRGEIPVEQITIAKKRREKLGDKEIVRYTLMSFGFSQADIEPDNARYLEEVRRDVSSESVIHITGSTDTMGDAEFNRNLSEQRARAVARVMRVGNDEVRGIGEQTYFDNALPEGRFYNRTVRVLIENPVK